MLGAITGDIVGSVYEFNPVKRRDFPFFTERSTFTDDTVLSVAVARAILRKEDYKISLKDFARRYPDAGYGGMFLDWVLSDGCEPYNSWGNGSAMRVSPVGWAFDTVEDVLKEARKSAEVTHNHTEGIKGAEAAALAVYLARTGCGKETIRRETASRFGYDLDRTLDEIRPDYTFDVSCRGTVPEAIIAFLESLDFEDAIRKAVSLGGDSDTLARITGGVAEAFYGAVSGDTAMRVREMLPEEFLSIIDEFHARFGP